MDSKFVTPIVFCTFNRLEPVKKVFEKIREIKPLKLYLVSDAPRKNRSDDAEKVREVRAYIENGIDWNCEVHKNYAEENMGCGRRISSGISWVFETEKQAIILEDDIIPDLTFFRYCEEMLNYYKDDPRILLISGNNPIEDLYKTTEDYLFSKVPFIWGWATWKRAWDIYDFNISTWPKNRNNPIWKKTFPLKTYWSYTCQFDEIYKKMITDTWSYQFMYAGMLNNMLCVLPAESHTFNIGFQEESTHTLNAPKWLSNNSHSAKFPIKYRKNIIWDRNYDEIYFSYIGKHGISTKIKHLLGMNVNDSMKEIILNRIRKK